MSGDGGTPTLFCGHRAMRFGSFAPAAPEFIRLSEAPTVDPVGEAEEQPAAEEETGQLERIGDGGVGHALSTLGVRASATSLTRFLRSRVFPDAFLTADLGFWAPGGGGSGIRRAAPWRALEVQN